MIKQKGQNSISYLYFQGSDLAQREQEVLKDASEKLSFIPDEITGRSNWWGSKKIGAFFVSGTYKNQNALLKIQGIKLTVSEIFMIKAFEKSNKSKLIRPPHLYAYLPWNDKKRYEALVLEPVEERVVNSPANKNELDNFLAAYKDYRVNCLKSPWIEKPKESLSEIISNNFEKWRQASFKLFPTHSFREKDDKKLIDKAVKVLKREYQNVNLEFQQGHFSAEDLYQKEGQIIVLSNLYWSWRPPLYDAIFGMHWFIYHLERINNITSEEVESQRNLWLKKIESLSQFKENDKLYKLALLERAAAGLNLDALSVNYKKPIAKYLVETTRKQAISLMKSSYHILDKHIL